MTWFLTIQATDCEMKSAGLLEHGPIVFPS